MREFYGTETKAWNAGWRWVLLEHNHQWYSPMFNDELDFDDLVKRHSRGGENKGSISLAKVKEVLKMIIAIELHFRDGGLAAFANCTNIVGMTEYGPSAYVMPTKCQGNPELGKLMKTVEETSYVEMYRDYGAGECNVSLAACHFKLTDDNHCFKFASDHSSCTTPDPYGIYARLLMQNDNHGPVAKIFELHSGDSVSFALNSGWQCSEINKKDIRQIMQAVGPSQATTAELFMSALLGCIDPTRGYEIFEEELDMFDDDIPFLRQQC